MQINDDIVTKILELSELKFEKQEYTQEDIQKALIEIERKLNVFSSTSLMNSHNKFNILVVDDLELSIFQFTQLLKKIGTTPNVARSKEEAIAEINKKEFDYIITDLYLPELNDGTSLIQELIKYKEEHSQHFKIIVISSTENDKVIEKVYSLGINEFIAKSQNWHHEVLKYIANTLNSKHENFSTFICENDICVYSIKQLNTQQQKDELLQDISASIFAQRPNIILNVERLKSFNEEYTSLFSEIFKLCQNENGKLILLSPTAEIKTALKNAFLNDLIKTKETIDEAITEIKAGNQN